MIVEEAKQIAAMEAARLNVPWCEEVEATRLFSGKWKIVARVRAESAQTTFFVETCNRTAHLHRVLYAARFAE